MEAKLKNPPKARFAARRARLVRGGKKPDIRHLNDMKEVLYDQKWAKTAPNLELYYMHRGLKERNGLRYDITIIPPKMLGKEFVKTQGHKHLKNFQELINVIEGKAFYLVQKGKNNRINDIYMIKAAKGDWIIVPPQVEHATINPINKKLVMANWISAKVESDYSLFKKFQGAGYYYTKQGWIKNKNYKKVPKLRFEKPLKSAPKDLSFLKG